MAIVSPFRMTAPMFCHKHKFIVPAVVPTHAKAALVPDYSLLEAQIFI